MKQQLPSSKWNNNPTACKDPSKTITTLKFSRYELQTPRLESPSYKRANKSKIAPKEPQLETRAQLETESPQAQHLKLHCTQGLKRWNMLLPSATN